MTGYRMQITPPRAARNLKYLADIYSDGSVWRWRAYVFEDDNMRQPIVETNGGEQDEETARQAAREWLNDQSRLMGADY